LTSCLKDDDSEPFDPAAQFYKEVEEIDTYLETNAIPHVKDVSGIRIVPTSLGTQLPPQTTYTISVDYKGSFLSTGAVFEESTANGFLGNYIPGWQIAMRKLPVGSRATIYIPSYYAYGNTGTAKVPANSTLVFEVNIKSATLSTIAKDKFTSDTSAINNYVASKSLNVVKDPTGVRYMHLTEGNGATPSWFTPIKVKYTYYLLSDDTREVRTYTREPSDEFSSFVVDYIQGMQVALQKMKVGGKTRVFVPSGLGFGIENATDGTGAVVIPANSNLIVDVELLEVK
jgi:FKBP-type peptidyl-prolyl cis-trans isomerase